MATAKELGFETETCSRCDGTGKHSFNFRHGSMCYGCRGAGWKLTKRGQAAWGHFQSLRPTATISELAVGDRVLMDTGFAQRNYRWVTIASIEAGMTPGTHNLTLEGSDISRGVESGDKVFRTYDVAELAGHALEYQGKLTKAGKLAKKYQEAA